MARSMWPSRIEVRQGNAEAFCRCVEAELGSHLREGAIAVVVVDQRSDCGEDIRVTVRAVPIAVLAAVHILEVPAHVTEDDEIEQSVIVEIDPGQRWWTIHLRDFCPRPCLSARSRR